MKLAYIVTVLLLAACHFEPTRGTLKFHAESGTFVHADNVYYETDSGSYNTGPISLPFNFSAHVTGKDVKPNAVGGEQNRAYLKVYVSAANNTTGGDLTTQVSYTTDFGETLGGRPETHTYGAGIDILQSSFTLTWEPGL